MPKETTPSQPKDVASPQDHVAYSIVGKEDAFFRGNSSPMNIDHIDFGLEDMDDVIINIDHF